MPVSAMRGGEAPADLSWLPDDLADFVGREREIERLAALLRPDGAVVVLAGMPGSGKTALAAHVARSMPGHSPADVAFTTATGLRRHRFDLKRYRAAPLLIADGLRSPEIDALLANADRPPRVLVTTRDLGYEPSAAGVIRRMPLGGGEAPLGFPAAPDRVSDEPATACVIRIGPFGDDEALRLLGFLAGPERLSREGDAAAEIVRLCGGLPLALRVAGRQLASRPRTSLREFAEQMRRRRWRAESRQGVASVIDDARLMLPDAAGRAFPLLAVAGESFPAAKWDAIVEVLDVPDPAMLAGALMQAGLLEPQGDGIWRAHPLIVSFAQAHLSRDAGLRAAAAQAMIRWHARSMAAADLPELLRAVQLAGAWAPRAALDDLAAVADSVLTVLWHKRLWPQWEQMHRAVRSAADRVLEPALQTRAAANLVIGYLAQHRHTEADAQLRHAAQSRPDGYPPEACARLWLHEMTLRWVQGDLDGAERLAARALAEANQIEDAGMVLLVRLAWAHLERDRGNLGAAVAQWTDIARDAAREAIPEVQALALIRAAKGSGELGAVDRAVDLLDEAVNVSAGVLPHEAIALAERARLELANGHPDRAYAGARRAVVLRFGPVEPLETGPRWIWWPRPVFYAMPVVAVVAGGLVAVATATVAPFIAGGVLACVSGLLARRALDARKRLALNVFRTIRDWLGTPELAAEIVPLSHRHYDRLAGGRSMSR